MGQVHMTFEQIHRAALAGIQILEDTSEDVKIPMNLAMTGNMTLLHNLLLALVNREITVVNVPAAPPTKLADEVPNLPLTAINGDDSVNEEAPQND